MKTYNGFIIEANLAKKQKIGGIKEEMEEFLMRTKHLGKN